MSAAAHDLSAHDAADRLTAVARRAVLHYDVAANATLTLLNISENATYAVDDPRTGQRTVLRVHRRGYHDKTGIDSELAWLDALRTDAGVRTPRVVPDRAGRRVLDLDEPGSAEPRHAVMFEWLPGVEPSGDHLVASFEGLGETTARMHDHVLA